MAAVTLALWGGLLADDDVRLQAARNWRKDLVIRRLSAQGTEPAVAEQVWQTALTTFREAWLEQRNTPGLAYCLAEGLAACGLIPLVDFDAMVADLENHALIDLPSLADGAVAALTALSERWPVGVICDTRVTPAPILRECLRALSIRHFIDVAVFSDELGAAKPSRLPFRIAAEELGMAPSEIVHIGPSEERDIAGAVAVGAWSIHLGTGPTAADVQCASLYGIEDAVQLLLENS